MTALALALAVVTVAGACGAGRTSTDAGDRDRARPAASEQRPSGPQRYEVEGLVFETERRDEAVLCLGGATDTMPPQCNELRLKRWSWGAVPDERTMGSTTYGDYTLTGLYDGRSFTVLDARPYRDPPRRPDPIDEACPEPPGGWDIPDPEMASGRDRMRALAAARAEPDYAGTWVTYVGRPTEWSRGPDIVLGLAFTGDLDEHEAEIRRLWGGGLCLVEHERTWARVREIAREVWGPVRRELGLEIDWMAPGEVENNVAVGVVTADPEDQRELDERYGEGAVDLQPIIRPVP
ncbi:MAG TPA: hypothetical protein VHJ34_09370 [Actinomycetota bacterium]|nr:hypothetical protein [Actinomycetota bacterium]